MSTVPQRLAALRSAMEARGIDAYLVPSDDFHMSEYVGEYFKCRKYLTGFTGSAGTAVVTKTRAALWTDGRYFLQAENQLCGSGFELMKMGEAGVPTIHEFLKTEMKASQTLGFDGRTVGAKEAQALEKELEPLQISVTGFCDLVGEIWEDRPALSCEPVMELPLRWCGESRASKLSRVREKMAEAGADVFLLCCLDDIAWLLNIRGNDVHCNPVVLSYFCMTQDKAVLFANEKAFPPEVLEALGADGVRLEPYEAVYEYVNREIHAGETVLLSREKTNSNILKKMAEGVRILDQDNPTLLMKAVKNPVEMENMKKAHIKDGAAVTKFIFWLKKHAGEEGLTELSAAEKLLEFRRQQENFQGESFDPIIAYREHGAIVHYSATEETDVPIRAEGMVLADTGGQYLEGTTDITRTIVVGPVTEEEKKYFTAVLKGHLRLAGAKFRYGCTGQNLDYLAREPLWRMGEDYNHGTGHGVGYFLNVHEGPNGFRWKTVPERKDCAVFEEGMTTSDEPGYYAEGKFGIRHENLILCRKAEMKNQIQFMCFEPLTMVPFDLEGIDVSALQEEEKALLNQYHRNVYEKIGPLLEEEERAWLFEATKPVG